MSGEIAGTGEPRFIMGRIVQIDSLLKTNRIARGPCRLVTVGSSRPGLIKNRQLLPLRSLFLFIFLLAFLPVKMAAAKICSLDGTVTDIDGAAVADTDVTVTGVKLVFHAGIRYEPKQRTVRTDMKGNFAFSDLKCGNYSITAPKDRTAVEANGTSLSIYDSVDLKAEHPLHLRLIVALKSDPGPEDPSITALRRKYFSELKPNQASSFEQASLAGQKEMYQNAMAERLAAETDLTEAERNSIERKAMVRSRLAGLLRQWVPSLPELDRVTSKGTGFDQSKAIANQVAAKKGAIARMLVQSALPPQDAAGFTATADVKSAGIFLRAIAVVANSQKEIGATAIMYADMDDVYPGIHVESDMGTMIGEEAVRHWPRTSTLKRCELLRHAGLELIQIAEELANDNSPDAVKKAMLKAWFSTTDRPLQDFVQDEFGAKAAAKYLASSASARENMDKATIMTTLTWAAAHMLL